MAQKYNISCDYQNFFIYFVDKKRVFVDKLKFNRAMSRLIIATVLPCSQAFILTAARIFSIVVYSCVLRACLDFAPEGIFASGRGIFAPADGDVGIPTASEAWEKSTGSEVKSTRGVNSKQALNVPGSGIGQMHLTL
jgi:hypothetical protein